MKHDFDWSKAPEPWREIGPSFRREVERIVGRHLVASEPPHPRPQAPIPAVHYPRPARTKAEVMQRHDHRLKAALNALL